MQELLHAPQDISTTANLGGLQVLAKAVGRVGQGALVNWRCLGVGVRVNARVLQKVQLVVRPKGATRFANATGTFGMVWAHSGPETNLFEGRPNAARTRLVATTLRRVSKNTVNASRVPRMI